MNTIKYLVVTTDDEEEVFYKLSDIDKIVSDYAQNILSESDLIGNDIKPLEMLTILYFNDNRTATFITANLMMYFSFDD